MICSKTSFSVTAVAVLAESAPADISDDTNTSKLSKLSASDFAASKQNPFPGFGLCGHAPYFDPTDVEEDPRSTKLFTRFATKPSELTNFRQTKNKLFGAVITYNDLSKVNETESKGGCGAAIGKTLNVQQHHLDQVKALGLQTTTATKKDRTLTDYNCGLGLATAQSVADGYFQAHDGVLRGIWEVKHGTDTPAEGLRQGATEASNIALHHLELGVECDDILVPVIASNGYLIQFAAVIMLKHSFPVMVVLSHVLDMTNDLQLDEAARLLCCVEDVVSLPLKITTNATSTPIAKARSMQISDAFYHKKPLRAFFPATGNVQTSLHRYFKIMARLHENEICRPYVCFPICVREFEDNAQNSSIVFPKLAHYSIGLPETTALRAQFIYQLKEAVSAFHAAGVVHMDLYLSNVMWRVVEESRLQIKVIDWDAAHFVEEELQQDVRIRLQDGLKHRMNLYVLMKVKEDVRDHDDCMKWYDLSLVRVWEHFIDSQPLQLREKYSLDQACITAQLQMSRVLESGRNDT